MADGYEADNAALRQRAEQAERGRDALQGKVDEARELVRGASEADMPYDDKIKLFHAKWRWDAERTAAAPQENA